MNIAIVTDAWLPQTNGVVMTLAYTARHLRQMGHTVTIINPEGFVTVPLPTYPDIRVVLYPGRRVFSILRDLDPDAIHIATEGPLGLAARRYCLRNRLVFTTSYHTCFPEYLRLRLPIPTALTYAVLRRFHNAAECTMVATASLREQLDVSGFRNLSLWSRGVDPLRFNTDSKASLDMPRPVAVYMGRVAVEKNIEAFLTLDLPGSKLVIGDGPQLASLRKQFPSVRFTGFLYGEGLVSYLAACDVFVFPSQTDTFGLVLLEAMACGLPVAAYPVTGPIDVVQPGVTGCLDNDLKKAVLGALKLGSENPRRYAEQHSWNASTRQFLSLLTPRRHQSVTRSPVVVSQRPTASW